MAIKVNGTTVIDDSRNLSNVGGLKTVNGTSLVGSGNISAGASTSWNAVGTYAFAFIHNTGVVQNNTYAGSALNPAGIGGFNSTSDQNASASLTWGGPDWYIGSLSGTWRAMGRMNVSGGGAGRATLFVRIS